MKLGITLIVLFSGVLIASVVLIALGYARIGLENFTLASLTVDVAGVLLSVRLVTDSRKGAKNGKY